MTDETTRNNFLERLKETEEIAVACGEYFAASVLATLRGALVGGVDNELSTVTADFSRRQIEKAKAEVKR